MRALATICVIGEGPAVVRQDVICLLAIAALLTTVCSPKVSAMAQEAPKDARKQQALDRALIKAVRGRDLRAVRELLDRGADANARNLDARPDRHGTVQPPFTKEKPTALLIVFDDAEIPTGRREHGVQQTRLRPDPAGIVKALLEKGANPNVIDYDETFPLLDAVQHRYAASVRLLLQFHANPNETWLHGITPLHRAVGEKDVATVKALLSAGANPNARCAFDDPAHPLSEKIAGLLKRSRPSPAPARRRG